MDDIERRVYGLDEHIVQLDLRIANQLALSKLAR